MAAARFDSDSQQRLHMATMALPRCSVAPPPTICLPRSGHAQTRADTRRWRIEGDGSPDSDTRRLAQTSSEMCAWTPCGNSGRGAGLDEALDDGRRHVLAARIGRRQLRHQVSPRRRRRRRHDSARLQYGALLARRRHRTLSPRLARGAVELVVHVLRPPQTHPRQNVEASRPLGQCT